MTPHTHLIQNLINLYRNEKNKKKKHKGHLPATLNCDNLNPQPRDWNRYYKSMNIVQFLHDFVYLGFHDVLEIWGDSNGEPITVELKPRFRAFDARKKRFGRRNLSWRWRNRHLRKQANEEKGSVENEVSLGATNYGSWGERQGFRDARVRVLDMLYSYYSYRIGKWREKNGHERVITTWPLLLDLEGDNVTWHSKAAFIDVSGIGLGWSEKVGRPIFKMVGRIWQPNSP